MSSNIFYGSFIMILRNNAGICAPVFTLSKDNIELQFATNYLGRLKLFHICIYEIFYEEKQYLFIYLFIICSTGHFLLTNLLLDTMKKTSRESNKEGRIVNVSSEGHKYTYPEGILFDEINDESR